MSATKVLVIEVPMLAPMTMGMAARTVSTGVQRTQVSKLENVGRRPGQLLVGPRRLNASG